jgi:hypothetical protein
VVIASVHSTCSIVSLDPVPVALLLSCAGLRLHQPVQPGWRTTCTSATSARTREKQIGGSGGSLEPPGPLLEPPWPLLTHIHTVYTVYSECLPARLNPLAERTSFSQARTRAPRSPRPPRSSPPTVPIRAPKKLPSGPEKIHTVYREQLIVNHYGKFWNSDNILWRPIAGSPGSSVTLAVHPGARPRRNFHSLYIP